MLKLIPPFREQDERRCVEKIATARTGAAQITEWRPVWLFKSEVGNAALSSAVQHPLDLHGFKPHKELKFLADCWVASAQRSLTKITTGL
jgi:hypothetical protein